jgi:hypothetical protein
MVKIFEPFKQNGLMLLPSVHTWRNAASMYQRLQQMLEMLSDAFHTFLPTL